MASHQTLLAREVARWVDESLPVAVPYSLRKDLYCTLLMWSNWHLAGETDFEELPKTEFQHQLECLNACYEAREWVGAMPVMQAWSMCLRSDWMLWLLLELGFDPSFPTDDTRDREVEPSAAWLRCEYPGDVVEDALSSHFWEGEDGEP